MLTRKGNRWGKPARIAAGGTVPIRPFHNSASSGVWPQVETGHPHPHARLRKTLPRPSGASQLPVGPLRQELLIEGSGVYWEIYHELLAGPPPPAISVTNFRMRSRSVAAM